LEDATRASDEPVAPSSAAAPAAASSSPAAAAAVGGEAGPATEPWAWEWRYAQVRHTGTVVLWFGHHCFLLLVLWDLLLRYILQCRAGAG
jgi:hypothetical protein